MKKQQQFALPDDDVEDEMPDVEEEYEVDSKDEMDEFSSSNNGGDHLAVDQISAAQLAAQDAANADQYSEENDQEEANKR
jgi:hypothetical protein